MKKTSLVIGWLSLALLVGCAALMEDQVVAVQPESGIGGTGAREYNGLGGTGKKLDSGLGGTGKMAQGPGGGGIGGTGIVGRVTAFGSIWVNGAHITFDPTTPVKRNAEHKQKTQFKLGQIVAVLTTPREKGSNNIPGTNDYQAQRITIVHEVVGPVSRVKDNKLWVLGQEVVVAKGMLKAIDQSSLQQGTWLQVSGHRRQDQVIVASRLDVVNAGGSVEVIGEITGSAGEYRIGNQPLQINSLIDVDKRADREFVSGYLKSGVLVAEHLGEDPVNELIEEAENLILEGFMLNTEDQFNLSGVDLMLPTAVDMHSIETELPIRINAELNGDVFEVDDVYVLPDSEGFSADEYNYEEEDYIPVYESEDAELDDGNEYEESHDDKADFDHTEFDESEFGGLDSDEQEVDESEFEAFDEGDEFEVDDSDVETFDSEFNEENMMELEYEDTWQEQVEFFEDDQEEDLEPDLEENED